MLELTTSFPPVTRSDAQLVILGSMPSVESLKQQRYYAHPRNALWPILTSFFGLSAESSYQHRCEMLKQHHTALWDVLKSCRRPDSLDPY